ncbi:MAG: hypothetical protein RBR78_00050 [Flavobacteriaceae bacterium]|jgi:hypothetical protein|nr:hypothetical protein [Flavobacteriaceae bacterium]
MSQIIEQTQMQNGTTVSEGSGFQSKLIAESCFVLQSSNSIVVTEANSFGPKTNEIFKTTTKFTFDSTLNVYSICNAQVLIQPQTGNNDLVNIILKPINQPVSDLPIKYIIYRGVNKSSIINADKITGDENTGSSFVRSLWKQFNRFFTDEQGNTNAPDFFAKYIGYSVDLNLHPYTKLLDELFYKLSNTTIENDIPEESAVTAYELPIVPLGMHLGEATGSLGVDILLDDGAYYVPDSPDPFKLDLAYARANEFSLELTSGLTDYEVKLLKNTSAKFIDYIAFIGLHTQGAGTLHLGGQTTPLTESTSIYVLLNNCHTKDTKYLYIQSDRQRCYNFYENYKYSDTDTTNLKIGETESTLTNQKFGEQWPVITHDNISSIKLKLLTDNHLEACLYASIGDWQTPHHNLFVKGEHLKQAITTDPDVVIDNRYTELLELKAPNTYAGIWQLIYKGQKLYATDANDEEKIYALKDIDDLLGLLDVEPLIKPKNSNEYASVIENKLQFTHSREDVNNTTVAAVLVKRIADAIAIDDTNKLERITFETLLINSTSSAKTLSMKDHAADNTITFDQKQNNFYNFNNPYSLDISTFIDAGESIKGIYLTNTFGKNNLKKIVGITKDEYSNILSIIETENLLNTRLFFENTLIDENDYYISPENIRYKVFHLKIVGEHNGVLKYYELTNNIKLYSLDNLIFFSSQYSEHIELIEKVFYKLSF